MVATLTNSLKLMGHSPILSSPNTITGISNIHKLQFSQDWEFDFQIIGSWDDLREDVIDGYGFAVSDGLFKSQQGAAAWIIEGSTSANRVIGKHFVPGHNEDHSSFCSELIGIYTCLFFCSTAFTTLSPANLVFT